MMDQNMKQIPGFMFRRWAMAAIKPVMSVLIVIALIAVLPELISTTIIQVTDANPTGYIEPVIEDMSDFMTGVDPALLTGEGYMTDDEGVLTPEAEEAWLTDLEAVAAESESLMVELETALRTFVKEKGAIFFGMQALNGLLTPMLSLALTHALLNAVRKQEVTLRGSLGSLRHMFKALVVDVWTMLRVQAWMLPGLAAELLGAVLLTMGMGMPEAIGMLLLSGGMLLLFGGMILGMVLGVRAGLHYGLASIVFADKPDLSPNACIRISWSIMRRRKMEFFLLQLSFIGWELLVSYVALMLASMFGSVIGDTLSMMANLLLSVYISATQVCFFLVYSGKLPVQVRADGFRADGQDDPPLN